MKKLTFGVLVILLLTGGLALSTFAATVGANANQKLSKIQACRAESRSMTTIFARFTAFRSCIVKTVSSNTTNSGVAQSNRPTPPGGFGSGGMMGGGPNGPMGGSGAMMGGPRGGSGSMNGGPTGGGGGEETVSNGAYSFDGTSCGYTPQTTEGPYYVRGTAALTNGNLNYDNLSGTPIKISGYVYIGTGNTTPLANATVDIWHADAAGAYHPQSNGQATNYTSDQLSLRGSVTTDSKGYYEFTSILAGEYSGRTRHMHIRAYDATHNGIITQMIISQPGDTILAANDSIAKSLPDCNMLSFTTVNGVMTSSFNFHIK